MLWYFVVVMEGVRVIGRDLYDVHTHTTCYISPIPHRPCPHPIYPTRLHTLRARAQHLPARSRAPFRALSPNAAVRFRARCATPVRTQHTVLPLRDLPLLASGRAFITWFWICCRIADPPRAHWLSAPRFASISHLRSVTAYWFAFYPDSGRHSSAVWSWRSVPPFRFVLVLPLARSAILYTF